MSESSRIPWQRLIVEGAVIVFSILLAFAIDAWWEERRERQAEVILLERLRADFIELRDALVVVEREHAGTLEACLYLMSLEEGDPVPATPDGDRAVAFVFMAVRTFNPGGGAVASFVAGEGAQVIRNKTLSDTLMAWSGLVEELQEEELMMQKVAAERWTPYLLSRVNLGPYIAAFGEPTAAVDPKLLDASKRDTLLVDQEFLNLVLERFRWQVVALRDLVPVQEAVEEILALVDSELAR